MGEKDAGSAVRDQVSLFSEFPLVYEIYNSNIRRRQLLPLIIVLVFLGAMAWVGYQIYLSMQKIQAQARRQMGDHVAFTKDGLRVQVKNIGNESYVDQTQSWVVKAWNLGSTAKTHDKGAHRKRYVCSGTRD